MSVRKLVLALDWTPNTNHSGFYLGIAKGWYLEAGIDLDIQSPSQEYSSSETPARRVISGGADLCTAKWKNILAVLKLSHDDIQLFYYVAPSESVISSWTSEKGKVQLKAVATILQKDTSAIVTKKDSGIDSVASLDNKKYASYEGRFEMAIVKQMIKNAGGVGDVIEVLPPKLDCFDAVLRDDAHATWVFMAWEGVQAKRDNISLNVFSLSESAVPYGYTPILLAHPKYCDGTSESDAELLKQFLEVTARSYVYASKHPEEAADALITVSNHPSLLKCGREFVVESQQYLSDGEYYLNSAETWGTMEPIRWSDFVDWLFYNKCILARDGSILPRESLDFQDLFTNQFLPAGGQKA